jgi:cytochrome P450
MSRLAHRFPALVVGEILGVPRSDWEPLLRWSDSIAEFVASLNAPIEVARKAQSAAVEITDFVEDLAKHKRAHPADDLISFMLASEEDGEKLSHQEMVAQSLPLLVAGHETTRNLIANGVAALLRHPDAMAQLRRDPGLVRSAVEEFLRFGAERPAEPREDRPLLPLRSSPRTFEESCVVA